VLWTPEIPDDIFAEINCSDGTSML
jgi:hypothetical protein